MFFLNQVVLQLLVLHSDQRKNTGGKFKFLFDYRDRPTVTRYDE